MKVQEQVSKLLVLQKELLHDTRVMGKNFSQCPPVPVLPPELRVSVKCQN